VALGCDAGYGGGDGGFNLFAIIWDERLKSQPFCNFSGV